VACWSTKAAISPKRVKIEEKLLWRADRKSPTLFRFFGSPSYFYFRCRLYGHLDGRFCLIFARTAQQSVLDGTNRLSCFKRCAYCRIVHRADIFAIAQLSCLSKLVIRHDHGCVLTARAEIQTYDGNKILPTSNFIQFAPQHGDHRIATTD